MGIGKAAHSMQKQHREFCKFSEMWVGQGNNPENRYLWICKPKPEHVKERLFAEVDMCKIYTVVDQHMLEDVQSLMVEDLPSFLRPLDKGVSAGRCWASALPQKEKQTGCSSSSSSSSSSSNQSINQLMSIILPNYKYVYICFSVFLSLFLIGV